jgi:hypothetical protein
MVNGDAEPNSATRRHVNEIIEGILENKGMDDGHGRHRCSQRESESLSQILIEVPLSHRDRIVSVTFLSSTLSTTLVVEVYGTLPPSDVPVVTRREVAEIRGPP